MSAKIPQRQSCLMVLAISNRPHSPAFGCEPCAVAWAHTKANAEPPSEVIAIVDEAGEITPLCEACYAEFIEDSATPQHAACALLDR